MYLDDMLVMAQSKEELEEQLLQITSLLEMLGFVINREKSQLEPTQRIQYFGFLIDSQEMKILLTAEKMTQIVKTCKRLHQERSLTVRELARLIGRLTATLPAIFPAPLWYRELQRLKNQAIQKSYSLEISLTLTEEAMLELATKMRLENGKTMQA